MVWDHYVEESDFGSHWKNSMYKHSGEDGCEQEEEEEINYSFELPGHNSFVGDHPWETTMGGWKMRMKIQEMVTTTTGIQYVVVFA